VLSPPAQVPSVVRNKNASRNLILTWSKYRRDSKARSEDLTQAVGSVRGSATVRNIQPESLIVRPSGAQVPWMAWNLRKPRNLNLSGKSAIKSVIKLRPLDWICEGNSTSFIEYEGSEDSQWERLRRWYVTNNTSELEGISKVPTLKTGTTNLRIPVHQEFRSEKRTTMYTGTLNDWLYC